MCNADVALCPCFVVSDQTGLWFICSFSHQLLKHPLLELITTQPAYFFVSFKLSSNILQVAFLKKHDSWNPSQFH